jgi:hypothetical protein
VDLKKEGPWAWRFSPKAGMYQPSFKTRSKEILWVRIIKKRGQRGGEGHGRIKINYICKLFDEAGPDSIK